jgi:hypothetical protein
MIGLGDSGPRVESVQALVTDEVDTFLDGYDRRVLAFGEREELFDPRASTA